jgi:antitoxin component YwqK of YwqJK toxin-antitoxin module
MSEPAAPQPKNRRRWLQFRLRTLLWAMTVCAIVVWFWRPQPPETVETGGLRIQARRTKIDRVFPGKEEPVTFEQDVLAGPVTLKDEHGRRLALGMAAGGEPVGTWRYYYDDGRVSQRLELEEGKFVGQTIAYDERGWKRAALTLSGAGANEVTMPSELQIDVEPLQLRRGEVQAWWPNGKLRHTGQFADDAAEGTWQFFDERGQLLAAGEFRRGLRSGAWQERDGNGELATAHYHRGLKIDEIKTRLAEAERQLASDNARAQLGAIRELGRLGTGGAERLQALLKQDDALLVCAALAALAEMDAREAADSIAPLTNDARTSVRAAALAALVDLDAEARYASFRQLLLHVQQHRRRTRELQLAGLGGLTRRHLDTCAKLLDDDDAAVRYAALWRLIDCAGKLREESDQQASLPAIAAIKRIAEQAAEHRDPWVRRAAREVLLNVDVPLPYLHPHSTIPVVG